MTLSLVILSRDNCSPLTSFHLLVLLLATGRTIIEEADHDLFSLRFKDVLAALLPLFLSVEQIEYLLSCSKLLYQWRAQEYKDL